MHKESEELFQKEREAIMKQYISLEMTTKEKLWLSWSLELRAVICDVTEKVQRGEITLTEAKSLVENQCKIPISGE